MDEIEIIQHEDDMQAVWMAVGFVMMEWAYIETSLDAVIGIIFHVLNGKKIFDEKLPRALKKKTTYLRRAFREIEALSPYKDEAIKWLDRISNQKDYRHDFAHSAPTKMTHENGIFKFSKVDVTPEFHRVVHWEWDIRNFRERSKQLEDLKMDSLNFALRMRSVFVVPELPK